MLFLPKMKNKRLPLTDLLSAEKINLPSEFSFLRQMLFASKSSVAFQLLV